MKAVGFEYYSVVLLKDKRVAYNENKGFHGFMVFKSDVTSPQDSSL